MLYHEVKKRQVIIEKLTNLGLINYRCLRNIKIFELFLHTTSSGTGKYKAYKIVAQKIDDDLSWQSIKNIVEVMSSNR